MQKEKLSLKKIQEIEEAERIQKKKREKKLNRIGDFYKYFSEFLNELQREYENEVNINPTSQKSIILKENIIKAKDLAKNIYEIREEIVVYYALSVVKGIPAKEENMTIEEKELFNSLISLFRDARKKIFEGGIERAFVETGKIIVEEKPKEEFPSEKEKIIVREEKTIEEEKIQKGEKAEEKKEEFIVVRILDDMNFVGTDEKNYTLKKEDVVSLPIETAKILAKRGKGIILRSE